MDIDDIRRQLTTQGLREVTHVEYFKAWRESPAGTFELTIEVADMGPDKPSIRYSCRVYAENGELLVTGNPDPTVEETITFVHWGELDAKLADWLKRNPQFR